MGVEMLVMVVVNIRYSQLSQAPQTEGGVAQSCTEHIHRTEMGLTDQPGSTEVLYFEVLSKKKEQSALSDRPLGYLQSSQASTSLLDIVPETRESERVTVMQTSACRLETSLGVETLPEITIWQDPSLA